MTIKALLIRPSGSVTVRDTKGYRGAMQIAKYRGMEDPLGWVPGGPPELTGAPFSAFLCRTVKTVGTEYDANPVASALCGVPLAGDALLLGWDDSMTEINRPQSVEQPGETMRFIRSTIRYLVTLEGTEAEDRKSCVMQAIGHLGEWRAGSITVDELHAAQFIPSRVWAEAVSIASGAKTRDEGPEPWSMFARGVVCATAMLSATADKAVIPARVFTELLEIVDDDTVKARDILLECCRYTKAALGDFEESFGGRTESAQEAFTAHISGITATLRMGEDGAESLIEGASDVSGKAVDRCEYDQALDSWTGALQAALTEYDAS